MFIDLLYQELGDYKDASGEVRFCCPFCGETDYKFYVDTTNYLWICFKCMQQGNPVKFVMYYYQVKFPEAKEILETYDYTVGEYGNNQDKSHTKYGAHLSEEEQLLLYVMNGGEAIEEDTKVKLTCPPPPTNCKALITNFNNPEAYPFLMYLHNRGVTVEDIKQHNISYVIDGESTLPDGRTLRLINHLVFFAFNDYRKPLYWNTRSIDHNPFIKSFNASAKPTEYSKSTVVMNLNNAKKYDKIIIVEGVFNVFAIGGCAVSTYGKSVSDNQIHQILNETKEKQSPIYIYLDRDAWQTTIKLAERIKKVEHSRRVYMVYNPTDEDANDLGFDKAWILINNAIEANSEGYLQYEVLHL
ncbi:DNA primase [Bacillus phage vB_BceH_LY2]|nr:DNA primase [Bacillus phage vB_BceH_LY2]